jgi:hypothetical protein
LLRALCGVEAASEMRNRFRQAHGLLLGARVELRERIDAYLAFKILD